MSKKKGNTEETEKVTLKKPPMLFEKTQAALKRLKTVTEGPVLTYWNSSQGSICGDDVIALHHLLKQIGPQEHLSLFVKSDGGSGQASLRMIHVLRQFTKRLTVLVPLEANSAATMLALGANSIKMGATAQLSAVDTSLTHDLSPIDRDNNRVRVSQDELSRVVRLWNDQSSERDANPYASLYGHIHPLVFGAVDRISALSTRICAEILSYHLEDKELINKISDTLNSDYPSHSYPITLREAQRIGLQVEDIDPEVYDILLELSAYYSEMGQKAMTDFDETRAYDSAILNILECDGTQVFYQNDKEWFYRNEERRWVTLNNNSKWHRVRADAKGKLDTSVFHI